MPRFRYKDAERDFINRQQNGNGEIDDPPSITRKLSYPHTQRNYIVDVKAI